MNIRHSIQAALDRGLAAVVMALVLGLSLVVILGFMSRFVGKPLSWTGEIAGVGLAWLTFYGSALAACRGAHIASPSIQAVVPPEWRVVITIVSEACTIAFFVLLAWTGLEVVEILAGSRLVSLPFISQQLTQSAVAIGACLFILAQVLRLPETIATARAGGKDPATEAEEDII